MRRVLVSTLWLLACDPEATAQQRCASSDAREAVTRFHGHDHSGAYPDATFTADAVEARGLELAWTSEALDDLEVDAVVYPPLVYASPLFLPSQAITSERFEGTTDVLYTATSNGWVYAIDAGCEAGRILWRRRVANAVPLHMLDQGVPMGVLSTPVIDSDRQRLYVAAHDRQQGWQLHALSLSTGRELADWPVTIDDRGLADVNTNGPARFQHPTEMSQRGALVLYPDGGRVYVAFGTYWGSGAGWLVAVDTARPRIAAAFSSAPSIDPVSSGGIWGSAGPDVDDEGRVWATTGNSPAGTGNAAGVWGNSLLQLNADLELERAYSPFDYCALDLANMDLGASQPLRLSPVPGTTTPDLIAFGGKQGVVYLLDVDDIPGVGAGRGPCGWDSASDRSLLGPHDQPQFGRPGPLSVFGPYSVEYGEIDHAKMRTKLAEWTDDEGRRFLFASGTSKESEGSTTSAAPSVAKLQVRVSDGGPAHLEIAATNPWVVMQNPGAPIVTGSGDDAIVWVLDRSALRSAPVLDPTTPRPQLYAFSAVDLRLL